MASLPEKMQVKSFGFSLKGMHLIVAFVSSLIFNSVSCLPSQPQRTKPPFLIISLNSLYVFTLWVLLSLKSFAWLYKLFCIWSKISFTLCVKPCLELDNFSPLSLRAIITVFDSTSLGPISIRAGTPFNSHSLNLYPGEESHFVLILLLRYFCFSFLKIGIIIDMQFWRDSIHFYLRGSITAPIRRANIPSYSFSVWNLTSVL